MGKINKIVSLLAATVGLVLDITGFNSIMYTQCLQLHKTMTLGR